MAAFCSKDTQKSRLTQQPSVPTAPTTGSWSQLRQNEADLFIHKLNIFYRSVWIWMEFSQVLFDRLEVENEGRQPGSYIGRRAMSQWPRRGGTWSWSMCFAQCRAEAQIQHAVGKSCGPNSRQCSISLLLIIFFVSFLSHRGKKKIFKKLLQNKIHLSVARYICEWTNLILEVRVIYEHDECFIVIVYLTWNSCLAMKTYR